MDETGEQAAPPNSSGPTAATAAAPAAAPVVPAEPSQPAAVPAAEPEAPDVTLRVQGPNLGGYIGVYGGYIRVQGPK